MTKSACHTLGAFKAVFYNENGRPPTEQEIFNAGMRGGRDINWPKDLVKNPEDKEVVVIDAKLFEDMARYFCAFAPLELINQHKENPDGRVQLEEVERVKNENNPSMHQNPPTHLTL